MPRPLQNPLFQAIVNVLETVQLGGVGVGVGRGEAPDCSPPYLIVSTGGQSSFEGPWTDPDADADSRIQVTAIGVSDEQSMMMLDLARGVLTFTNLTAEGVAGRKILSVDLNLSRPGLVEQRGIPEPIFSNLDQYLIRTTPE